MEVIYSDVTISMSEFKKNPAAVLRDAKSKPVAVLNHNKAAFYMVEPALFEALLEELSDQDLHRTPVRLSPNEYSDKKRGRGSIRSSS